MVPLLPYPAGSSMPTYTLHHSSTFVVLVRTVHDTHFFFFFYTWLPVTLVAVVPLPFTYAFCGSPTGSFYTVLSHWFGYAPLLPRCLRYWVTLFVPALVVAFYLPVVIYVHTLPVGSVAAFCYAFAVVTAGLYARLRLLHYAVLPCPPAYTFACSCPRSLPDYIRCRLVRSVPTPYRFWLGSRYVRSPLPAPHHADLLTHVYYVCYAIRFITCGCTFTTFSSLRLVCRLLHCYHACVPVTDFVAVTMPTCVCCLFTYVLRLPFALRFVRLYARYRTARFTTAPYIAVLTVLLGYLFARLPLPFTARSRAVHLYCALRSAFYLCGYHLPRFGYARFYTCCLHGWVLRFLPRYCVRALPRMPLRLHGSTFCLRRIHFTCLPHTATVLDSLRSTQVTCVV